MTPVLIGLGSNLGDRAQNLNTAWQKLEKTPSVQTLLLSEFIETEPMGGPTGQPLFLNAAGVLETELTSRELLTVLLDIENQLGRVRKVHNGPRTIDLDLLLFGAELSSNETLTVPHPRMHERLFVLEPAVTIAPNFVHPQLNLSVQALFCELKKRRIF